MTKIKKVGKTNTNCLRKHTPGDKIKMRPRYWNDTQALRLHKRTDNLIVFVFHHVKSEFYSSKSSKLGLVAEYIEWHNTRGENRGRTEMIQESTKYIRLKWIAWVDTEKAEVKREFKLKKKWELEWKDRIS